MIEQLEQLAGEISALYMMIPSTLDRLTMLFRSVNWRQLIRVGAFVMLAVFLASMLILLTDRIFEHYMKKQIRVHHLKIKNNGNTPSIFLLRTIDLPKQLAIRFRSGGNPMIWVSQTTDDTAKETKEQPEETKEEVPEVNTDESHMPQIPNLKKPLKDDLSPKKAIQAVGKKAGFFASLFATITSLLPFKVKGLSEAQDALKGIQQGANNTVSEINTKIGNLNTLKSQVDSMGIKTQIPEEAQKLTDEANKDTGIDFLKKTSLKDRIKNKSWRMDAAFKNFVYDETVWHKNLNKVDEMGGSLNYVQTQVLKPGDSMNIDVEILNMNESGIAASLVYKIEVVQLPQTKLQLSAPRQYIRGIVVCPKVSIFTRLLPAAIVIAATVVAIQFLAWYSYIVF